MSETKGVKGLTESMLREIKTMVDANTMLGEPVTSADGTIAIPVSRISVGFGSGGVDFASESVAPPDKMGGGIGGGYQIVPVGFLIMSPTGGVSLLEMADRNRTLDRALNMMPGLIQKIGDYLDRKSLEKKDAQYKEEAAREIEETLNDEYNNYETMSQNSLAGEDVVVQDRTKAGPYHDKNPYALEKDGETLEESPEDETKSDE